MATCVCSAVRNLRCTIQGGTPSYDHSANRLSWVNPSRQIYGCVAIKEESPAREPQHGLVHEIRGKHMRFGETGDLGKQGHFVKRIGIIGGRVPVALVYGVNPGEGVEIRKHLVESSCAEVFAH